MTNPHATRADLPTFEHAYSGEVRISGDPRSDIAEAVELDHGCEDVACDIQAAMAGGFVFVAAHALMSATDADLTSEVVGWYVDNGPEWFAAAFGAHLRACSEWPGWSKHHDRYARPCGECGSYSYAEHGWEPTECGCCGVDLVPTDAHARRIAADWHPGITSALLSFASTGTVRPDLRDEVEDEVSGEEKVLLLRWLDVNAPEIEEECTTDEPTPVYVRRFDGLGEVWEVRWHGGSTFNLYADDVEVDVFTRYGDDRGNAPTIGQARQFIEEWASRQWCGCGCHRFTGRTVAGYCTGCGHD